MTVYKWLERVKTDMYPPACLLCGAKGLRGLNLCLACKHDLPWNRSTCPRCAVPLPPDTEARLCGACLKQPPPWDWALSPFAYGYPADRLIQRFKFHGDQVAGRLLGELLAEFLVAGSLPRPDFIVPVPLHRTRLRERGFNQAVELARPVSRRLGIPFRLDVCVRERATEVQSKLDSRERKKNLRHAFAIKDSPAGKHVAILDDVVTTGATAEVLAEALKDAGASCISVWSVARAALRE